MKPLLANAERTGDGPANSAGRWRLNAGSEMILKVGTLNKGDPIRVVLDVVNAKFAAKRIVALSEHEGCHVIGFWENPSFSADGSTDADLHVVRPTSQEESAVLAEAVRLNALIKANVPIQTSIGAEAGPNGKFELVPDGETIKINGQEYTGGGDLPLYILRGGLITEASVVTFGADAETGRLAAMKSTILSTKETPMSDKLKALLGKFAEKHHGLVARCVAENLDEAAITTKIQASEMEAKDKELADLKAKLAETEAKCAKFEAEASKVKADDYNQGDKDKKAQQDASEKLQQMAASKALENEGQKKTETTETTVSGAIKAAIAAGAKERGFALRAKVLAENPNLQRI